jgi:membrane fusion protein (multidrug efflux system)
MFVSQWFLPAAESGILHAARLQERVIGLRSISFRWIKPERLRRLLGLSIRLGILVIAAAVAILFASRWDSWVGAHVAQTTDDAYVKGDLTPLSAKVDGYLRKVPVNDFQHVKANELLVEIEDDDYKARVDQAEADVAVAEAAIENLKSRKAQQHAQIAEAQSAITATQADVERTRLEEIRQRDLVASTYGTRQRLEQATADEKRFQATLARARDELESQRSQMAVLDTQELQLRADLKSKQAVLALARITLGYTRIVSPVDGMVGERGVRTGQYVRPGVQVISVVPLDTVWVVANFKETQLTRMKQGQDVEFEADSYPGVAFHGKVESISGATGARFALLPPDNSTGNFVKVTQRVPVKIVLSEAPDAGHPLRPGMSVDASVRVAE